MAPDKKTGKDKRRFTVLDILFHIGVAINLVVVILLLWYAAS